MNKQMQQFCNLLKLKHELNMNEHSDDDTISHEAYKTLYKLIKDAYNNLDDNDKEFISLCCDADVCDIIFE